MAEPDAAGAGAPGEPMPRTLTREDIDRILSEGDREWEALSPDEKAARVAEAERADHDAFEDAKLAARPTLDALQRLGDSVQKYAAEALANPLPGASAAVSGPFGGPADPPRGLVESPSSRKAFAEFLSSIEPANPLRAEDVRKAVAEGVREGLAEATQRPNPDSGQPANTPPAGPFTGGAAWSVGQSALAAVRLLEELGRPPADQQPNETPPKAPPGPPASVDEIKAAARDGAEEGTKKALAESKTDPKPRGKTTCERLEDLHVNVDSHFAISSTIRELSERIQKSEAAINDSHYYQTKLRQPRREYRLMEQARKRAERGARRWGNFDSVGSRDEASEGPEGPEDH